MYKLSLICTHRFHAVAHKVVVICCIKVTNAHHDCQGPIVILQSTICASLSAVLNVTVLQEVRCNIWWQAVAHGKWLVIEDLNLAPPEVLAALVPLLGSRQLHLPQRAQVINAAPGFQLLASITTAPGDPPSASQPWQGRDSVMTRCNLSASVEYASHHAAVKLPT